RGRHRPKTATIVYDLIPMQFQERYLNVVSNRRWFARWTKLLNAQDLLLAISESTRSDLLEILRIDPQRVATIGTASDPEFFSPERETRPAAAVSAALEELGIMQPFLFNVNGDDDRKNALGLVEAFARLPQHLRDTHQLVVSGSLTAWRVEAIRNLARD